VDNNISLARFCGLNPLLSSGGLGGAYYVSGNLFNPTLQEIIDDGPCTPSDIEETNTETPIIYELLQNFPNPFNPSTVISYSIPQSGFVQLKVYDLLGREVVSLVNEEQAMGNYEVEFNASGLTSGIYFYKLECNGFSKTKKLILMK